MPLSNDPEKRQRQLENLRPGGDSISGGRPREHGGYARLRREQLAEQERRVLDLLGESAPVKTAGGSVPAADQVVVTLLAEVLCRLATVSAAIDARLWGEARGDLGNAVVVEARLRREALRYCEQLGMSPMSRHRLGLAVVPEEPPAPPDPDEQAQRDAALARLHALDAEEES